MELLRRGRPGVPVAVPRIVLFVAQGGVERHQLHAVLVVVIVVVVVVDDLLLVPLFLLGTDLPFRRAAHHPLPPPPPLQDPLQLLPLQLALRAPSADAPVRAPVAPPPVPSPAVAVVDQFDLLLGARRQFGVHDRLERQALQSSVVDRLEEAIVRGELAGVLGGGAGGPGEAVLSAVPRAFPSASLGIAGQRGGGERGRDGRVVGVGGGDGGGPRGGSRRAAGGAPRRASRGASRGKPRRAPRRGRGAPIVDRARSERDVVLLLLRAVLLAPLLLARGRRSGRRPSLLPRPERDVDPPQVRRGRPRDVVGQVRQSGSEVLSRGRQPRRIRRIVPVDVPVDVVVHPRERLRAREGKGPAPAGGNNRGGLRVARRGVVAGVARRRCGRRGAERLGPRVRTLPRLGPSRAPPSEGGGTSGPVARKRRGAHGGMGSDAVAEGVGRGEVRREGAGVLLPPPVRPPLLLLGRRMGGSGRAEGRARRTRLDDQVVLLGMALGMALVAVVVALAVGALATPLPLRRRVDGTVLDEPPRRLAVVRAVPQGRDAGVVADSPSATLDDPAQHGPRGRPRGPSRRPVPAILGRSRRRAKRRRSGRERRRRPPPPSRGEVARAVGAVGRDRSLGGGEGGGRSARPRRRRSASGRGGPTAAPSLLGRLRRRPRGGSEDVVPDPESTAEELPRSAAVAGVGEVVLAVGPAAAARVGFQRSDPREVDGGQQEVGRTRRGTGGGGGGGASAAADGGGGRRDVAGVAAEEGEGGRSPAGSRRESDRAGRRRGEGGEGVARRPEERRRRSRSGSGSRSRPDADGLLEGEEEVLLVGVVAAAAAED
ncbi:hypothetical protein ACHAWF_011540, partial [Thalassiosira exigua]